MTHTQTIGLILLVVLGILGLSCTQQKPPEKKAHAQPATLDTNLVLPPAWSFGVLYGGYTNQKETIARIRTIQQKNYPIDAYWIDSWFWDYQNKGMGPDHYIDFVGDTVSFPNREKMWSFMEENHIKGGFWVWDCILEEGNEQVYRDFKEKGYFSETRMYTGSWHNKGTTTARFKEEEGHEGTLLGEIDFENPEAAEYFKQKMKHFFDEGADFIKLDRSVTLADMRTMFEITQEMGKETRGRGFILSHRGGLDDPAYKRYPAKWTSDTRADWTVEDPTRDFDSWVPRVAFKENIELYTDTSQETSEIPFLTNDMGGFDIGKTDQVDEELYLRWMQFSMFCPITEVFSQPENPTSNMPWKYSERADSLFRHLSHVRMQLFPYIYSYAHRQRLKGEHMIGKFPEQNRQYLFGDQMLVAPVYQQGARSREMFLPGGDWINFWTNETITGNQNYTADAPITRIPVFVKAGSIIPMRNYASSIEAGSNDTLNIHIYPGADGRFTLIEDDGTSSQYLEGIYAKTTMRLAHREEACRLTIDPLEGYYEGIKRQRTWKFHVHGDQTIQDISINGEHIEFQKQNLTAVTKAFSNDKYDSTQVEITF